MLDFLFKQAMIIDGSGEAGFQGDVAVKDHKIEAVCASIEGQARRVVDAQGLALAPGFTDIHGHSDLHLLDFPSSQIKLRQGVTLDIAGNCGFSVVPLIGKHVEKAIENLTALLGKTSQPIDFVSIHDYARTMESRGLSTNMGIFTGHSTLRALAVGLSNTRPNFEQLEDMKRMLARELDLGALGLSSGLIYLPGCYSETEELICLAGVVRQKGGIYVSHIRNESDSVLAAIEEAIKIGREAKVPVHISHMKICGRRNWQLAEKIVSLIEDARAGGLDVTCDVYPYTSASTTLLATLPPWVLDGGIQAIMQRLGNRSTRRRMIVDIKAGLPGWHNFYIDQKFGNCVTT